MAGSKRRKIARNKKRKRCVFDACATTCNQLYDKPVNSMCNTKLNPCQYDAGEIFKGRPSGRMITGYDQKSDNVPVANSFYQFSGWQSDLIVWWMSLSSHPLFVFGPAGCGKTSGLKQIAARINYPVWEVTGYDSMQPVDMEGQNTLEEVNGATAMRWLYGPLALAMKHGGLFIFNEMDMASPSSLVAMNTILDGSPLTIESTGEIIHPHPMFKFAATGNSNGSGDDTGAYTGVMRQNFALQDRFITIEANYMPRQVEQSLLAKAAPSLPPAVHAQMMEFATIVRAASRNEAPENFSAYNDFILPISTRAFLRWGEIAEVYAPAATAGVNVLEKSLMLAFANTKDKGQVNAYREILQRVTGNG